VRSGVIVENTMLTLKISISLRVAQMGWIIIAKVVGNQGGSPDSKKSLNTTKNTEKRTEKLGVNTLKSLIRTTRNISRLGVG
jgi:hypothetical protein